MTAYVDQAYYGWSREELPRQEDSREASASQMLDHGSISFGRLLEMLFTFLVILSPQNNIVHPSVEALLVIDYLIANGSERALDDILEHSFRISVSISAYSEVWFACCELGCGAWL
ncbi:uncharacterized protein A4U43_C08F15720 [Asparagus officinalis]|nr:uncharacterized protein A4U43_C08F15720 [Asparagus officinalis]